MSMLATLVHRNLAAFWRDKMTVFFSLLSPLILFILFVVFFRKTTADLISSSIPGASVASAYALCDAWMFASVTTLATFSSSLGMLTGFVEDRVTGRFSDYLVSPIRRWQLALGYVVSTLVVSFVISTALMALGQGWCLTQDQPLMTGAQIASCLAAIFTSSLIFCAFNTLIVTFLGSQGAFGGYSIIMGTAMGFLSFCYVPPASLSQSINSVLSVMPFAQAAALIRDPAMRSAIEHVVAQLPEGEAQDNATTTVLQNLGAQLEVNDHILSVGLMFAVLLGLTVILAALGSVRMGRVIR